MGGPSFIPTQPHDIIFQLHSAHTSVQLLVLRGLPPSLSLAARSYPPLPCGIDNGVSLWSNFATAYRRMKHE